MTNLYRRRSDCRLCGQNDFTLVLKLEPTPPANAFVKKKDVDKKQHKFPLDVFFCEKCNHVQLLDIVDPKILFENYVYVSGTSPVFVKHFEDYSHNILTKFHLETNSLIVDIGSNDGTLLNFFKAAGHRVLGIDPAKKIAKNATKNGIETLPSFFNYDFSKFVREKYGLASVVTANNVFAHVDELKEFVRGIRNILSPTGIFVFEVSYLVDVIEKTLFDMIYHEHLSYHSIKPLIPFFGLNDLQLVDAWRMNVHGGSIRGFVQHKDGPYLVKNSIQKLVNLEDQMKLNNSQTFKDFSSKINEHKVQFQEFIKKIKFQGKTIAGFGASAKATTLMYHFGIDPETIDFIVDDNPIKQGLFSPGLHIPVFSSKMIYEKKPDYLIIMAWNFAESIIKKHADFGKQGGHFIIPLPNLEVY